MSAIKEKTIAAIKKLIALQQEEARLEIERMSAEDELSSIALEDVKEAHDEANLKYHLGTELGENNYITIDGIVYELEFTDEFKFYRLRKSTSTHF